MRKISFALAFALSILFAVSVLTYSQGRPGAVSGSWGVEVDGVMYCIFALRADGSSTLTGAVAGCLTGLTGGNYVEISDGTIVGNRITFKYTTPDGYRTMAFSGEINGDEILFNWESKMRQGGTDYQGVHPLFRRLTSSRFTAKRISDSADSNLAAMADLAHKRLAPITFDRILRADQEPQNWLTYSGILSGQRFSRLFQITPANVGDLRLTWFWQAQSQAYFEATPLVLEGVLYTVQAPNDVVALDATTGREIWTYKYAPKENVGYRVNRGLAILGGTLFMGTLDAHLLAINAHSGKLIWDTTVANAMDAGCKGDTCYQITHAPLVVKDKVIVGTTGGEGSTRSFIAAFDAATGKEVWRFFTIPGPGEPGNDTWSGDSWKTGGAPVWNTGTYDPDLNLTYWGTGNPSPTGSPESRLGDNLYSDSVVALDADTGKLKWYYQFTPHDDSDWDSTQIPVLADIEWQGRPRKAMLFANRNGLMYVLDRTTGQFLMGKAFVEVNWMSGFDERGRPVRVPPKTGIQVLPGAEATNWYPPSYNPTTGLFYIPVRDVRDIGSIARYGAMRAIDPLTGERRWEFKKDSSFRTGALTTASGLLFTGGSGEFYALDARTGELLWRMPWSEPQN